MNIKRALISLFCLENRRDRVLFSMINLRNDALAIERPSLHELSKMLRRIVPLHERIDDLERSGYGALEASMLRAHLISTSHSLMIRLRDSLLDLKAKMESRNNAAQAR